MRSLDRFASPSVLTEAFRDVTVNGQPVELDSARIVAPRFGPNDSTMKLVATAPIKFDGQLTFSVLPTVVSSRADTIMLRWSEANLAGTDPAPTASMGDSLMFVGSALARDTISVRLESAPSPRNVTLGSTRDRLSKLLTLPSELERLVNGLLPVVPLSLLLLALRGAVGTPAQDAELEGTTRVLVLLVICVQVWVGFLELTNPWGLLAAVFRPIDDALMSTGLTRRKPWLGEGIGFALVTVAAVTAPMLARELLAPSKRRFGILGVLFLALSLAAASAGAWLLWTHSTVSEPPFGDLIGATVPAVGVVTLGAGVGALLWLVGLQLYLRALSGRWLRARGLLLSVAALAVLVYVQTWAESKHPFRPRIGSVADRWFWVGATLVAGLGVLLAIAPVATRVFTRLSSDSKRVRRPVWIFALLLMIAPIGPFFISESSLDNLLFFHRGSPAYAVQTGLAVALFIWWIAILAYCRDRGTSLRLDPRVLDVTAIAGASVLFPVATEWIGLPVRFVLGYAALKWLVHEAKADALEWPVATAPRPVDLAKQLQTLSEANSIEGAFNTFRRKAIADLASGQKTPEAYRTEKQQWEAEIAKSREAIGSIDVQRERILGFGPETTAWKNAIHSARLSLLVALPWIALAVREGMTASSGPFFPIWDLALRLAQTLATWGGIGFLFGYLFPYIRGRSGLTKAVWFAGTLLAPLAALQVLGLRGSTSAQAFLFWTLQLFVHCLVLGLWAFDFAVMKRAGLRDWRAIFEVHGVPALGVSLSSILVALATAVVTLVTAGVSKVVPEVISLALSPLSAVLAPLVKR